jgi:hypothetical protein
VEDRLRPPDKLREAIAAERRDLVLEDTVEIDGCYVGGHRRNENKKADYGGPRSRPVFGAGFRPFRG